VKNKKNEKKKIDPLNLVWLKSISVRLRQIFHIRERDCQNCEIISGMAEKGVSIFHGFLIF
jgi:hypothetical protein